MKLLMCAPDFYSIEYEINPWMSRTKQSTPKQASEQWQALRRILEEHMKVDIFDLESQPGLPDMVFTANGGLVWDHKFIVSNFRHDVRRGEEVHFEAWFRHWGFNVTRLPPEIYFEGEGDVLRCGDTVILGLPVIISDQISLLIKNLPTLSGKKFSRSN
jgi:N-dimethylarginine dimethylaminohydrolase